MLRMLIIHLIYTSFDGGKQSVLLLKCERSSCRSVSKIKCCSPVKKYCRNKKKNVALCPDYYSHIEFLSALWNTVSFQSEAHFGAGTKLTVLGKIINIWFDIMEIYIVYKGQSYVF